MITKPLYSYKKDGYIIDSPNKPECEYTERYRLVADDKKLLTKNGTDLFSIIDIDITDYLNWREVDMPQEMLDRLAEKEARRKAREERLARQAEQQ